MRILPGAHYDLIRAIPGGKGEREIVQTSFEGGDVEKRRFEAVRGLVKPLEGLSVPGIMPTAPVLEALARQAGVRFSEMLRISHESGFGLKIAGAAEIFPDEGLDLLLEQQPRNTQAIIAPTFLGLFTSQTASTVPARTAVLATQTGVTEVANAGAYARVSTAAGDWGAIATSGTGRRTTSAQKSFPESTASWSVVMGFFVGTASGHSTGKAFFYANFDDGQSVNVNAGGFTIRLVPFWHLDA